jgi:hypothetical protein
MRGISQTKMTSQLHKPDPVGTLPKPCNAGLIDIEWVIEDLTKGEVQQSWWNEVFRIKRFRYKAFSVSSPGLVWGFFATLRMTQDRYEPKNRNEA